MELARNTNSVLRRNPDTDASIYYHWLRFVCYKEHQMFQFKCKPFWCNPIHKTRAVISVSSEILFACYCLYFPVVLIWVRHFWNSCIYLLTSCLFTSLRVRCGFFVSPHTNRPTCPKQRYVSHLGPFSRELADIHWRSHALGTWVPASGHVTMDNSAC
jgi:hypothetical protein